MTPSTTERADDARRTAAPAAAVPILPASADGTGPRAHRPASSAATITVAVVAVTGLLYFGHEVLVPIALGLLLSALLYPAVQLLRKAHVPTPAGAAIVVIVSLLVLGGIGAALAPPLRGLASDIPKSVQAARTRLAHMKGPFGAPFASLGGSGGGARGSAPPNAAGAGGEGGAPNASGTGGRAGAPASGQGQSAAGATTQQAGNPQGGAQTASSQGSAQPGSPPGGAQSGAQAGGAQSGGAQPGGTQQSEQGSSAPSGSGSSSLMRTAGRVFGTTSSLLSTMFEVLLLTIFILAPGDAWRRRTEHAVHSSEAQRRIVHAVGEMRATVSRYMLATALINVGQGIVVGLVAWAAHLPSPLLWGVLTFLVEFIPYLGGAALMVLLLAVGLATGSGARAFLVPVAYLVITSIQNNVVSPIVYGRRLCRNPAAILVSVMAWWTLWGVAGAFLAVPILAAVRILTEHVDALRPLGPYLEG